MSRYSKRFISLADLYLAYRKAKAEAFFETTHHHALAFVEYEQNLQENLERLLRKLRDKDSTWAHRVAQIGSYIDAPKSVGEFKDRDEVHFHALDPLEDWQRRYNKSGHVRAKASFRLMMLPYVETQIISALWIVKAGYRFDFQLDRGLAYGNRLRGAPFNPFEDETSPGLNKDCIGLFVPYFSAYRSWRENGLRAMRNALIEGKQVVAITMDLRQFYHRVSPKFLLRKSFLKAIKLRLTQDEIKLTRDILEAITTWYRSTPDFKSRPEGGLPVGLSASKIIANVLLSEFDRKLVAQIDPVYYGRYVDDIFLVINPKEQLTSGKEVMQWLAARSDGMLRVDSNKEDPGLRLTLPYAADSDLFFSGEKQKIFYLHSDHGLDLVEQISEQIRRQSSEYRLLRDLPDTSTEMSTVAILATPDARLEADALRKADVVSVRRLGFSLLLRDAESYANDLGSSIWRPIRKEFYGLVNRHLLTPKGFFDYFGYLHRVFGLMVACRDFDAAVQFLERFAIVAELIRKTTTAGTVERPRFEHCKRYYVRAFVQAAIQATTVRGFKIEEPYQTLLKRLQGLDLLEPIPVRISQIRKLSVQVLNADWGRRPYKDYWYYSHREDAEGPPVPRAHAVRRILRLASIRRFRRRAELRVPHWPALAFPTRPLTVPEIVLIAPSMLENHTWLRQAIMGLRGARVSAFTPMGMEEHKDTSQPPHLHIPNESKKIRLAVTSVETTYAQWRNALRGRHDRSLKRYRRLRGLVRRILEERPKPDYISFPECSLPRRWGIRIAEKLAQGGVSMLGGLEYYKKRGKFRNDCLLSLTTNWPGYGSHVLRLQPKLAPAHGEAKELKNVGATLYQPTGAELLLPVYVHGGFCFGVLLCSDLTNIQNRRYFQGQVDGLFVLEWNPDVQTFSFLVEATAHDVHAFIVQVNNRMYGDSRVRVPYKEEHRRDAVRVKGGAADYYVVADIDYLPLRAFQKRKVPPRNGEFKPVPIGFEMSSFRKNGGKTY